MESSDRKLILDNLEALLSNTQYEQLVEMCQKYNLLSNVMVANIEEDAGKDKRKKHEKLLIKLTQRGPKAYRALLDICRELGYTEARSYLKPASVFLDIKKNKEIVKQNLQRRQRQPVPDIVLIRASTTDAPVLLEEYTQEVSRKHEVQKTKSLHTYRKENIPLETYKMTSDCRGILFLVNIIDVPDKERRRNGADIDKENLIDLFRQMNFKIFYYENLYQEQFASLVDNLATSQHLRKPDCLVFALLTHGSMVGNCAYAEFTDGGSYKVEDIIKKFSNTNCPKLIGKPKIFLFPFCRGNKPDQELTIKVIEKREVQYDGYGTVTKRYPSFSDILICYATVPGYETHRDPQAGSWYVQKFCAVLAQYAHSSAFEEMLKLVHQKVGEMQTTGTNIQTPSFESRGFNKVLYFNPGCSS